MQEQHPYSPPPAYLDGLCSLIATTPRADIFVASGSNTRDVAELRVDMAETIKRLGTPTRWIASEWNSAY